MKKQILFAVWVFLIATMYIYIGDIGVYLKKTGGAVAAIYMWRLGVHMGNEESKYRLGMAYWMGDTVERDLIKARVLLEGLRLSGDQRPAYFALADIYENNGEVMKARHVFSLLCGDDFQAACVRLGGNKY